MENEGLPACGRLLLRDGAESGTSGKPFRSSWSSRRRRRRAATVLRMWRVRPASTGLVSRPGARASHAAYVIAYRGPGNSRVTLAVPGGTAQPVAEIEGLTGLKVRLFMPAGEALEVLSPLLDARGAGFSPPPQCERRGDARGGQLPKRVRRNGGDRSERAREEAARGRVFVFRNGWPNMLRVLFHDGSGSWLCTERPKEGGFSAWPKGDRTSCCSPLLARELQALIWGGDPLSCRRPRKRLRVARSLRQDRRRRPEGVQP